MTCRTLTAFLLEIVEGDLDADSVLPFTYHLSRCSRCTRYVAQYRYTVGAARTACYALEHSMVLQDAFVESGPRRPPAIRELLSKGEPAL